MTEGSSPQKDLRVPTRSHTVPIRPADHHVLSDLGKRSVTTRRTSGGQVSTHSNPSISPPEHSEQTRPGRGPGKFVRKLWYKIIKIPSPRSARESPKNAPIAFTSSSAQSPISDHPGQMPSSYTAPALESNPDKATNLDAAKELRASWYGKIAPKSTKAEPPAQRLIKDRIVNATPSSAGTSPIPGIIRNTSATNNQRSDPDEIDEFSAILTPLKMFNPSANNIQNTDQYANAKAVMSVLAYACKMILDQVDRDVTLLDLLKKVSEVYDFMNEDEGLEKTPLMQALYGKIARQALECADFIVHYSETKSTWERLSKDVIAETDAIMMRYNNVLESLMRQVRNRTGHDTDVNVHHMVEDIDFGDIAYADGAGWDASKCCLPGTRGRILSEIKSWIDSTGENVPCIVWLSGTAGKGKSAIAHTIASWFHGRGDPVACFCFDREADRRHEKIFTTIARDLADRDPIVRRALARVIHNDSALGLTEDITRQWQELILEPVDIASKAVVAPILIVIDALDESGGANSRKQILRLLSGKLKTSASYLPENLRILVTSRGLEDISNDLHDVAHVRHISLNDILPEDAEPDIRLYISNKLAGSHAAFSDRHFKRLAEKSNGLFEWARLACEYIEGTNGVVVGPMDRFDAVISGTSESNAGTRLLDQTYGHILGESLPDDEEVVTRVRSVMGQILASLEPPSMAMLTAMRLYFPGAADGYEVREVIVSLGSLFTGTMDSDTPIRPLHASFYDFLTDKSRSGKFFVDLSLVNSDLAFASLRVMEHGLRFNICSLESSYIPNSAVPNLEDRVKKFIPAELSYSCRFWGAHVRAAPFDSSLAKEIKAFLDKECLLFWLEVLSLLKDLSGSVGILSYIVDWFKGHAEYMDIDDSARDVQRFIRTFATTILHCTPHLYLSALPFSPTQSVIFKKFATKFPRTPRVITGHAVNWPLIEKILRTNSPINAIATALDGRRIACGLDNGMIEVWDTVTGEALGTPLQGHTDRILSVAISPDGRRIVSGSADWTVRIWDAYTSNALPPLQGHTSSVNSIAISPDGKYIVSGSTDTTIRVWDIETGNVLRAPLGGHTLSINSVAISPDGNCIASGSEDRTIRMWDVYTGKELCAPLQGPSSVNSVAISPDGKHIVSGSTDRMVRVWDMDTGNVFGTPLQGHTSPVNSIAISPDGNYIVSGSDDTMIWVWDAHTGEALGAPLQGHTLSVNSIAISPDGNCIISASDDKMVRVWGAAAGTALHAPLLGHSGCVRSIAISPDGRRIVSGSTDKTIRVWDGQTGMALGTPLQGHNDYVRCIAVSPDGNRIISGSDDQTIRLWDMNTEASCSPLLGHTQWVHSIAISPDGRRIVSGSADKTVRVWDGATGDSLGAPLQGHTDDVLSVVFSPDGKRIISGSADKTIRVWHRKTGKALGAPLQGHTDNVTSVAMSLDGLHIVSASDDMTIRVWDGESGQAVRAPLRGHTDYVRCVAISPDGGCIVSGSDDMTIRIWDAYSGNALGAPLQGHTDYVRCVTISPDGSRIVSGSDDKTIRVWNLEYLKLLQLHESPTICFSSDPTHALSATSSFLESPRTQAPLSPNEEGWLMGPNGGRLLLWIPIHFHPVMYAPENTLVIPNDALQLDLSCFAHGTSWHECREQELSLPL